MFNCQLLHFWHCIRKKKNQGKNKIVPFKYKMGEKNCKTCTKTLKISIEYCVLYLKIVSLSVSSVRPSINAFVFDSLASIYFSSCCRFIWRARERKKGSFVWWFELWLVLKAKAVCFISLLLSATPFGNCNCWQ